VPDNNPAQSSSPHESALPWYVVPLFLLAIIAFIVAWHFVDPAPPKHVVIAAGPKDGAYYAMAEKYVGFFKAQGITLDVRETGGSVENFSLLTKPDSGVDLALVQAGSSPPPDQRTDVVAVAAIYYEPVLVFYRGDETLSRLSQLAGKKIAIGANGSGVRVMAQMLLSEAGVSASDKTTFTDLGGDPAASALEAGTIDAAFYVISPSSPIVARLLAQPNVHLMSFDHASAYGRLHPFLTATTLYRGSVDVAHDLPQSNVSLVAAPTTLAARESTHKVIVQLLVRAAQEFNSGATLLSDPGEFPKAGGSELPFDTDAKYWLHNPPNILHRTLPFWLATLIDRLIILLLPLLVVLIPLARLTPAVFNWRVQHKLQKRYRLVRQIEQRLTADSPKEDLQAGLDELHSLSRELATLKLPVSSSKDLFDLRNSVEFVTGRLEGWLHGEKAA